MNDQRYDLASKLVRSTYRFDVADRLEESPAIPSHIAEDTGHEIAHVSRALGYMREAGLVELIVPEDTKKGRIYRLTEDGEEAIETAYEIL